MIIQAGSVDISNLKTDAKNADEYLEFFKHKTISSVQNTHQAAIKAANNHPELKKVILMKQIPRYDSESSNPPGLKPYLSKLFNDKLGELCDYEQNSRIQVGTHKLECIGGIFEARYRNLQWNPPIWALWKESLHCKCAEYPKLSPACC